MPIPIVIGAIGILVVFAIGLATAGRDGGFFVVGVKQGENCAEACAQLQRAHKQTCDFRTRAATDSAARDAAAQMLGSAQLTAAALLAAAIAASLIPFVGVAIASGIWTAYLATQTYVVFLLGQLAAKAADLGSTLRLLQQAITKEAEAVDIVRQQCSDEEANRCIASLPPCP